MRRASIVVVASIVCLSLIVWMAPPTLVSACRPYEVSVTFHVFGGYAQVEFNGQTYSNGQSAYYYAGCGGGIAIAPVISGRGTFVQWQTDAGSFAGAGNGPTEFYSNGAVTGNIYLVVNGGALPWYNSVGGYALAVSGVYAVTGRFTVPSFTYVSGSNPNEIGMGVGIGGFFGGGWGWWTMLVASISSSGSVSFSEQEWAEPGPNGISLAGIQEYSTPMYQVAPGHVIDVGVKINPSTGDATDFVCDVTAGGCAGQGHPNLAYDAETVEWFATDLRDCYEADTPPVACHAVPSFFGIPYTVPAPATPTDPWYVTSPVLFGPLARTVGFGQNTNEPLNLAPNYIYGTSEFEIYYFNGQLSSSNYPVADTWVQSYYSDQNEGASTVLVAGTNAINIFRDYLRWDLQYVVPVGSNVQSVVLYLYLDHWAYGSSITDGQLYYVSDSSWTQMGITWNNQPSSTTWALVLNGLGFSNAGQWYAFDLTNTVWNQVNLGNWNMTFMLKRSTENYIEEEPLFYSTAYSYSYFWPVLEVQYVA